VLCRFLGLVRFLEVVGQRGVGWGVGGVLSERGIEPAQGFVGHLVAQEDLTDLADVAESAREKQ
jgi:hypothetical protein